MIIYISIPKISIETDTYIKPLKYKLLGYSSTPAQYKEALLEVFPKEFIPVIDCESSFRHYSRGSVLKSPKNTNGTYDWGWLQINDVHRDLAKKMGIDFEHMTPADAVEMAKVIMEEETIHAWVCSR